MAWQGGKIIKVALSTALKQTAARDLEPRSKEDISEKNIKWSVPVNNSEFSTIFLTLN